MADEEKGNPFLKKTDEELEAIVAEPKPEAKEQADEEADELEQLFEEPEGDPGELFPDDEGEDTKPPENVPYGRFSKVVAQRNEERTKAQTLEQSLKAVEGFTDVIKEKYSKFKDPHGQVLADANWMEAFEALHAAGIPEATALGAQVKDYLLNGSMPNVSNTPNTPAPAAPRADATPAAPAADPRVDALVTTAASDRIDATLTGLKPAMKSVIADHILETSQDLAALDAQEIKALAGNFIRDKGFTKEDVLANPSANPRPKPPTSSGRSKAATVSRKAALETGEQTEEGPKDVNEWRANRDRTIADAVNNLE